MTKVVIAAQSASAFRPCAQLKPMQSQRLLCETRDQSKEGYIDATQIMPSDQIVDPEVAII
jgi:hypothetical protein